MQKIGIGIAIMLILIAGTYFAITKGLQHTSKETEPKVIVIDPGHGGFDPGKVGVNNLLEKEINLGIALKLKPLLEEKGYKVVMTRETDDSLHEEGSKGKKQEDMRRRVECINENNPLLAVSIHQNSFTEASSHGAQVFYHSSSSEGEAFAKIMQAKIKEVVADDNHREAKSNENYYMLKKTKCPLVIVECGFLSNYEEAEKLGTEAYQELMAKGILEGILAYLESSVQTPSTQAPDTTAEPDATKSDTMKPEVK